MSTVAKVKYSVDAKPVDIYTVGNIVQHKEYKGLVLLVTRGLKLGVFNGVRISDYGHMQLGEHISGWDAGKFKQFQGTITLEAK